jgi:hypothetical protein
MGMTDTVDFDPPAGEGQEDFSVPISRIASLNGRAVMPDGSLASRGEILQRLGLNPDTSPTAWLTVLGCGSNASALLPGDLERVAVDRVSNASQVLRQVRQVAEGGFADGGKAPG